jgi:hypothetical protein
VENSAAPKANAKPAIASRNLTQTWESPRRRGWGVTAGCALVGVRSEITLLIRRFTAVTLVVNQVVLRCGDASTSI